MKTLTKGERLPKYKYKQFSCMSSEYFEYWLWDENENLIGTLYQPRWRHWPRKFRAAEEEN